MVEMLRIYSKGFLENVTIEELPPAIFLYGIIVQGITKVRYMRWLVASCLLLLHICSV